MSLSLMSPYSTTIIRTAQRCYYSAYAGQLLQTSFIDVQQRHVQQRHVQQRHVHVSAEHYKIVPNNLGGRSKTAQDWLTRQLNDPYVHRARTLNYRARSAFKLLELQERHTLLCPGAVVLECGASPGAWTQVAVQHTNPRDAHKFDSKLPAGVVVGVDLQVVTPVPGATIIAGDFTQPETQKKLLELFHPLRPDVVLSDMAPSATGNKGMDHQRIMTLAYTVAHFAKQHAAPGSSLVCKAWSGGHLHGFTQQLAQLYEHVKIRKPPCSRTNSAEVFVIAKGLKGGVQQSKNQTCLEEIDTSAGEDEATPEENHKEFC